MKRMHASSRSLASFVLVAVAAFGYVAGGRSLALAGDTGAAGAAARAAAMAKTVTIDRDTFGVPHVYGPTDASCVFGFIYAQAEDYFWQIEDSYLRSLGRAAEVYGEKSLPDDLVNRALEITRLSREEYQSASPKTKEICQAIADGLNYYLAVNPQVKPRLITHFEPWHPLAFRRFILYQSFIYGKSGLHASDILSAVQEIHDNKVGAVAFPADLPRSWRRLEQDRQSMSEHVGSNMWAVRPDKSASGKALMFINPHQPFFGPGQWYEGHVVSGEGWNLLGACFFGSPFPTLGYNGHVAWSHTVNNPDIVDLYAITFDDKTDPLKYRYGDGSRQATAWTDDVVVKDAKGPVTSSVPLHQDPPGPAGRRPRWQAARHPPGQARRRRRRSTSRTPWDGRRAWRNSRRPCGPATCRCSMPWSPTPAATSSTCTTAPCRNDPRSSIGQNRSTARTPKPNGRATSVLTSCRNSRIPKCGFLQNCNQSPLSTTPVAKELQAGEVG